MRRRYDLRTGIAELHNITYLRDINGTALVGAGIEEFLEIHRGRRFPVRQRRHYDPADAEILHYASHSAHVVGMRVCSYKIVYPLYAAVFEVFFDAAEVLVLAAVDEHYLPVTGEKRAVALSHIYEVYRKGIVRRKIGLRLGVVLPYEQSAEKQYQQYQRKIQCFVLFGFPLFTVCRTFPELLR